MDYLRKRGFTLIELLVVMSIIAVVMSILLPAAGRVRMQAKVMVVNAELRDIGLALECYCLDNLSYPPTREDCQTGSLGDHLFQLPSELVKLRYLPGTSREEAMSTSVEDRFHRGFTYKYRSVGECIRDRDIIDPGIRSRMWVPNGFPGRSSLNQDDGRWYEEVRKSPVDWVLFSLGPGFDEKRLRTQVKNRYPVSRELWYDSKEKSGFIVRMKLDKGDHIGTFSGDR